VATVEQTMMKVQRIMTGPMGLKVMVHGDQFRITFHNSSTYLMVRVVEWGTDDAGEPRTLVLVSAPILRDLSQTPELFEWVARQGGSRWFGHVEVHGSDESDNVSLLFSHTLLGDYLDQPELETAMWGILSVADNWDDELQQRFGGKRTTDE
jgi:adenylate cyclase